jgi:hypothetical protein
MKSSREKVLLLVMPVLLVGVLYVNWVLPGLQGEIQKAETERRGLQARAGSPAVLAQKSARLAELTREAATLQATHTDLERQWASLTGPGDDPLRSEKIEQLTGLLKRHGLNVIEQGHAEGKEATIPPALEGIAKRMAARGEKHRPQLWRFRIQGTYAAMLGALVQLAYGEPAVTPLGLTMKEAPLHSDVREWTLVVWV